MLTILGFKKNANCLFFSGPPAAAAKKPSPKGKAPPPQKKSGKGSAKGPMPPAASKELVPRKQMNPKWLRLIHCFFPPFQNPSRTTERLPVWTRKFSRRNSRRKVRVGNEGRRNRKSIGVKFVPPISGGMPPPPMGAPQPQQQTPGPAMTPSEMIKLKSQINCLSPPPFQQLTRTMERLRIWTPTSSRRTRHRPNRQRHKRRDLHNRRRAAADRH